MSSEAIVLVARWNLCSYHLVAYNVGALHEACVAVASSCSICNKRQLRSTVTSSRYAVCQLRKGESSLVTALHNLFSITPAPLDNRFGGLPSTRNAPPPPSIIYGAKIECYFEAGMAAEYSYHKLGLLGNGREVQIHYTVPFLGPSTGALQWPMAAEFDGNGSGLSGL